MVPDAVDDTAMARFGGRVILTDTAGGHHGLGPIHHMVRLKAAYTPDHGDTFLLNAPGACLSRTGFGFGLTYGCADSLLLAW